MNYLKAAEKLHRLYREKLAAYSFPSEDCSKAQISDDIHGKLVVYLADIAGIASQERSC